MERDSRNRQNYGSYMSNGGYGNYGGDDRDRFEVRMQDERRNQWSDQNRNHDSRSHNSYQRSQGNDRFDRDQTNSGDFHRQYQSENERDYNDRYQHDRNGGRPYQQNYSQDRDQFGNSYPSNFHHDPTLPRGGEDEDLLGNIRQGYGISSFDGSSDRFNTLDSEHRYGNRQDEQPYFSNDRDGYQGTRFGGGMGESGVHSNRGVPNYGTHNFSDSAGSGLGSTYGGNNYGGGRGYAGGHRGGTLGNSSFGSYAGNYGGFGPGGSTYGGGRSSFGDTAHNSDRSATELGGH